MDFKFSSSVSILDGDVFELVFPPEFVLTKNTQISAILSYTLKKTTGQVVSDYKNAPIYVYPSINKIHVYVPQFFNIIGCAVTYVNQCKVQISL